MERLDRPVRGARGGGHGERETVGIIPGKTGVSWMDSRYEDQSLRESRICYTKTFLLGWWLF